MSSWCSSKGYDGAAAFLHKHSEEEMEHMKKLFQYVSETGGSAEVGEIKAPPKEYESLVDVFKKTFDHEKLVTKAINDLTHGAISEQDYSTFNFLQWYVAEQHEEEWLFQSILNKIEVIGTDGGFSLSTRKSGSWHPKPL
jgi:ferritin